MNESIKKIIDGLFAETEMTEDATILHDELLADSEDRLNDLLRSGLSEEEALAAVTESLNSMKEVIDAYPKKKSDDILQQLQDMLNGNPEIRKAIEGVGDTLRSAKTSLDHFRQRPEVQDAIGAMGKALNALNRTIRDAVSSKPTTDEESDTPVPEDAQENAQPEQAPVPEEAAQPEEPFPFESFEHTGRDSRLENTIDDLNRFETQPEPAKGQILAQGQRAAFPADQVRRVDLCLTFEDLSLETSPDGQYAISWDGAEDPGLSVSLINGTLTVRDDPKSGKHTINLLGKLVSFQYNNSCAVTLAVPADRRPELELSLTSGDLIAERIALSRITARSASGNMRLRLSEPADYIRLESSGSGDIELEADAREMLLRSVSGNVDVRSVSGAADAIGRLTADTTSGDIDLNVSAQTAQVRTMSGDIDLSGRFGEGTFSTVSGDIDSNADIGSLSFKTVSGDAGFRMGRPLQINGSSVSGDIDIILPFGTGIRENIHTRSGDVDINCARLNNGVPISLHSTSGDIRVQ